MGLVWSRREETKEEKALRSFAYNTEAIVEELFCDEALAAGLASGMRHNKNIRGVINCVLEGQAWEMLVEAVAVVNVSALMVGSSECVSQNLLFLRQCIAVEYLDVIGKLETDHALVKVIEALEQGAVPGLKQLSISTFQTSARL